MLQVSTPAKLFFCLRQRLSKMFAWDAANTEHIALHGVLPEEAEQVVTNNPLVLERQIRNGKNRIFHLGETAAGRILFVVVVSRGKRLRVITAFPADRKSRKFYSTQKGSGHAKTSKDAGVQE